MGCEGRIEEPIAPYPTATGATAGSSASTGMGADLGVRPRAAAPGRCIDATPPEPMRTARVGADPTCPDDPLATPPALRRGSAHFEGTRAPEVEIEIAEHPAHRQRGLMYRRELGADQGMIFVFEQARLNRFWMHNTCISLDMLFISEDGTIVGIQESTPTMSDSTFASRCQSKYVLEVVGGFCRQHGVVAGQHVRLEGL